MPLFNEWAGLRYPKLIHHDGCGRQKSAGLALRFRLTTILRHLSPELVLSHSTSDVFRDKAVTNAAAAAGLQQNYTPLKHDFMSIFPRFVLSS